MIFGPTSSVLFKSLIEGQPIRGCINPVSRPLNYIFNMLKRCTAAKIQYYFIVSWFLITMTDDIAFAAHFYVNVKKSQIPFHVNFSKVNCRLLCNEFANFKYSSGSQRTVQIISSTYLLNNFISSYCLLIAATSTNANNILHVGVFLIRYDSAFCFKPVFARFTFNSSSPESHSSVTVFAVPVLVGSIEF